MDITDRFYQFRFVVEPHTEKKAFSVREEITDMKQHEIRGLSEELLENWVQRKKIDSKTEQAIRDTYALQKEIDASKEELPRKSPRFGKLTTPRSA